MMFLTLSDISKSYINIPVLNKVSFGLEAHKTLSILGKSGCGKSTLLKIIAGIEQQDTGSISLGGKVISDMRPNLRNIVYIFQEALLFPHMDVFENIAFGLRIRKEDPELVKDKVNEMLSNLELTEHMRKMPQQLSGGQKQRVAFGRALIIRPPLILLDEPFSSLDVETRCSMQLLYKKVAQLYQISALFVTHDLKEALIMGDQMAYMQDGKLKLYENKEQFINEEQTGVKNEINFWNSLN